MQVCTPDCIVVGVLDWLGSFGSAADVVVRDEAPAVSPAAQAVADLIARRIAAFTMAEARQLPAVIRALSLISSTAAQFAPLVYDGGTAAPLQPRVVAKPDPFGTRAEFVSMTILGLVEEGCAYWRHLDLDPETHKPRALMVLPHDEVDVRWDDKRMLRRYRWREMDLTGSITHITVNRRAGELHGRGPLREGLSALAVVAAAEDYARGFFASGGIPPTVIKALGNPPPTAAEAQAIKAAYMASRDVTAAPAVIGRDFDLLFPAANPQTGQMQESRAYGATIAGRLLGIPGPLLHIETSGASIVYQNAHAALEALIKATVLPVYLVPIEQAWSDLLPASGTVRFDLLDIQRADIAGRATTYKTLIDAGVLRAEEARAFEGWSPTETEAAHQFETPVRHWVVRGGSGGGQLLEIAE